MKVARAINFQITDNRANAHTNVLWAYLLFLIYSHYKFNQKMKTISYELTMPNIGSWNGKWTGAENKYYVVEKIDDKTAAKLMEGAKENPIYEGFFTRTLVGYSNPRKSHYYNFGDGWGANICLEIVDSKEAAKRRKISKGFQGYEWMISSIKRFGEILNSNQINEREMQV